MIIRRAVPSDLETIIQWRKDAAQWLSSKGSDQWSDSGLSDEAFIARVRGSITDGETWMADRDGRPIGTIAIDERTDDGLWTATETASGIFVHRMIIDRDYAGHEVGSRLLAQADRVASARGKEWVRLDAWTTNSGLHRYYEAQGFEHVRTVAGHHSPSAALFARPVFTAHDTPTDEEPPKEAQVRKDP